MAPARGWRGGSGAVQVGPAVQDARTLGHAYADEDWDESLDDRDRYDPPPGPDSRQRRTRLPLYMVPLCGLPRCLAECAGPRPLDQE